jgi:hypothetical protein
MHVSLKQIEMLMTFDKYKLLLLYNNNHYMYIYISWNMFSTRLIFCFSNVYIYFTISLRGNVGRVTLHPPPRHGRTHPLTYLQWWFYLIFIYMSSFFINLLVHLIYFIIVFVCRALRPPDIDRRPFLRLWTTRSSSRWWERAAGGPQEAPEELEVGAAQQEAPMELEARGAQLEAPEGSLSDDGKDWGGQPQAPCRLVKF